MSYPKRSNSAQQFLKSSISDQLYLSAILNDMFNTRNEAWRIHIYHFYKTMKLTKNVRTDSLITLNKVLNYKSIIGLITWKLETLLDIQITKTFLS